MNVTPEVIASLIGGSIEGRRNCQITGFAKIEEAKSGDISFIANPKYTHFANSTKASALIVSDSFEVPENSDVAFIKVKDPYAALAKLMSAFAVTNKKKGIDKMCRISDNVELGDDVYVGAFAYIGEGCKIGKNVQIYPQAYIGDNVEIGAQSGIQRNIRQGSRVIGSPAVDIGDFARQVVYIKNLERLNNRVDALEKKLS